MKNPLTNNQTLIILSGKSGSGKSTFAEFLQHHISDLEICCADDYFTDYNGQYNFDASKLGRAHDYCKKKVWDAMEAKTDVVVVANTSTSPSEWKPYKEYAQTLGYEIVHLAMLGDFGSIHGVPENVVEKQANKLQSNIKF